jgi:uncharacterized RmlC-like cupin family protein
MSSAARESRAIRSMTAAVVRSGDSQLAEQGSVYRPGIGAESVGSKVLWLGEVSLPAGARTRAHRHEGHETALLMIAGEEIEIWSGASLECSERVRPGDYLFIPAGVPHVAVNRCDGEARFIGARNDPNANESVVLMPELDGAAP